MLPNARTAMRELPQDLECLLDAANDAARERAWDGLVAAHSRLLLHVARAQGGDHDAAMDRYAYVLEALREDDFRRLRTFARDGRSKFSTWLVVVARRLCLDHHRHRYGRVRESRGSSVSTTESADERAGRRRLLDLVADELDDGTLADDPARSPEETVRRSELSDRLAAALADLTPRELLLLRYRYHDGLSAREIADTMGFESPFHVYRRLQSLCARLRGTLALRGVVDAAP